MMSKLFTCYASAAFGLEGLVADELKNLKLPDVSAENGGVCFSAAGEDLFQCNLRLRFTDRLYIQLAYDQCTTFEELYQMVKACPWSLFFSGNEAINISAKCTRSQLMSPRDCQSVSKKAVIENIRRETGRKVFPETGAPLPILISIRNNRARILLNTSGEALSRRGYRTWNGEAPLRETLAAALSELSPWKPGMPLHDPCCGTGTILIESAFMAAGRVPGLNRHFAMEHFPCFHKISFDGIRMSAAGEFDAHADLHISGSDIDSQALDLAKRHIRQAGLDHNAISLTQIPLQELMMNGTNGVFLCNPPYGERLGDQVSCRELYRDLRMLKERHPGWNLCAISSDPAFERSYGKKADKKRRLYNGRLECVFYIFY